MWEKKSKARLWADLLLLLLGCDEEEGDIGTLRSLRRDWARSGAWVREATDMVMEAEKAAARMPGMSL